MPQSVAARATENFSISTRVIAGRFADQNLDKLRGGYYTPAQLAQWLAAWSVQKRADRILEPSCGDGSFLNAATTRLIELGAGSHEIVKQLVGIEIVPTEAEKARARMRQTLGLAGNRIVANSDFFTWALLNKSEQFDCVLGNPPFIRYQAFPEPSRILAMTRMVEEGLKANRLTNIWVPFVVAATTMLRRGGRMGLVLPAELLQVTYAAQLRSYLISQFSRIDVIACNELFFDNAEQEVVLLLADGRLQKPDKHGKCRVALTEAAKVEVITAQRPIDLLAKSSPKVVEHSDEKWLKYFLSAKEIALMREVRLGGIAVPLKTHGSIDVGVVTGKNEFFVLTQDEVKAWDLSKFVVPLVSRAVQMKGAALNQKEWEGLAARGDRVFLLNLTGSESAKLPAKVKRYIAQGVDQGFHTGFKCSNREPWYSVPSIWIPDAFFFRQIYDFPRVVLNGASATSTDTIHRMRAADPKKLIRHIYTHLTAASAEIEGRSYGGGVLELEPTEAEKMLVPAKLQGGLPLSEIDKLIRVGKLQDVLLENDRLVLLASGLSKSDCVMFREIWIKMRDRRLARRRHSARSIK